jgi:hypothetical protein
MKPEFLKELEKRMGPTAAHKFYDEHFLVMAGSATSALSSPGQKSREKKRMKKDYLDRIVAALRPSEVVREHDDRTNYRWEFCMPKEYIKNG